MKETLIYIITQSEIIPIATLTLSLLWQEAHCTSAILDFIYKIIVSSLSGDVEIIPTFVFVIS